MNTTFVYGLLLALVNGMICISIPVFVSYTQRKIKQSPESQESAALNPVEILSPETVS